MTATQILLTLDNRGAKVLCNGDKLLVVPSAALDDELRAAIRGHKAELLQILAGSQSSDHSPTNNAFEHNLLDVPSLLQRFPGAEYHRDGLWRWHGFIVVTRGSASAYRKHWERRDRVQDGESG